MVGPPVSALVGCRIRPRNITTMHITRITVIGCRKEPFARFMHHIKLGLVLEQHKRSLIRPRATAQVEPIRCIDNARRLFCLAHLPYQFHRDQGSLQCREVREDSQRRALVDGLPILRKLGYIEPGFGEHIPVADAQLTGYIVKGID